MAEGAGALVCPTNRSRKRNASLENFSEAFYLPPGFGKVKSAVVDYQLRLVLAETLHDGLGDAVRIQDAYVKTLSDADQQAYANQDAAIAQQAQTEITAQGVSDTLSVVFQAPYVLGQPMLQAVLAAEHEARIDALFRKPPTADAAFVTPSTLLEHRTFQQVPTPKLARLVPWCGVPRVSTRAMCARPWARR